MSKLSIRWKMIAVIAFLLIMSGAMGAMAVHYMQAINGHTVEISTNWLPSVRVVGQLRADVLSYRSALRDHLMGETAEEKAQAEKKLAAALERVAKDRKSYEPMITSPEERALYDDWSRAWGDYFNGAQEAIKLSRDSVGRTAVEARAVLIRNQANGARADEALQKDIDLNDRGAANETKAAADGYSTAIEVIIGIIVLALLGGLTAGFYLIRDVSQGIASIIKPMQSLGAGDLAAEVPHRGEVTEMGAMADALQVFKEALIAKKAADEAAARDAEAKIERGRRVDAITRNFETMIGEIVETVSSASTELEASAGTLTATAGRAQELTTTVAAASEEASTNVQSVASATEELSSSVTEISRQVQESARMAGEAVDQARRTNERVASSPRPLPASATWSSSSAPLPGRPTCLRSMPPSRPRAPEKPAAASRWSPPR